MPVSETWRTVSVAAASCTDANIASTAALVRKRAATAWLADLGLPAMLVDWSGEVTRVGGWPEPASAIRASQRTPNGRLDGGRWPQGGGAAQAS
jgi:thiamine biosynthesis lipoprotein